MCLFLKDLFLFLFSHSNILLWNFFNTWKGIKYNENTHVQYLPEDVIQLWHIWSLSALSYPTGTSTILTFGFTFHAFLQCYRIFSIPMWHQTLIPRECSDSLGFAKGHLGAHLGKKTSEVSVYWARYFSCTDCQPPSAFEVVILVFTAISIKSRGGNGPIV